ncbi:MAG: hypothetical protein WC027_00195 [Candidatus Paceibacterota bacterium]
MKMMLKILILLIVIALIVFIGWRLAKRNHLITGITIPNILPDPATSTKPVVISGDQILIDLNKTETNLTGVGLGFTFGFDATSPNRTLLEGLKPEYVRGPLWWFKSMPIAQRINSAGMRPQVILSDLEPTTGWTKGFWPGENDNWTKWETYIGTIVREIEEKIGNRALEVDIFNEPTSIWVRHGKSVGWSNAEIQNNLTETWRRAFLTIRKEAPTFKIAGPSFSGYDSQLLKGFIDFSAANNVMPDILTWHELDSSTPEEIPTHVAEIKTYLATKNLNPKIQIQEYGPSNDPSNPVLMIRYFKNLEKAQIDASAKACWNDPDGTSGCLNGRLDNLINGQGQAKSIWYAFKGYSQLSGKIITTTDNINFPSLVTFDLQNRKGGILLGSEKGGNISLKISNLPKTTGEITVQIVKVPFSNSNTATPTTENRKIKIEGASTVITLEKTAIKDIYLITLDF